MESTEGGDDVGESVPVEDVVGSPNGCRVDLDDAVDELAVELDVRWNDALDAKAFLATLSRAQQETAAAVMAGYRHREIAEVSPNDYHPGNRVTEAAISARWSRIVEAAEEFWNRSEI